jgi:hypothetical protein
LDGYGPTGKEVIQIGTDRKEFRDSGNQGTRQDPFEDSWDGIKSMLEINPGLEAKTIFEDLQRRNAGRYADGQLRSLQRHIKIWRASEGPAKEVFFLSFTIPASWVSRILLP